MTSTQGYFAWVFAHPVLTVAAAVAGWCLPTVIVWLARGRFVRREGEIIRNGLSFQVWRRCGAPCLTTHLRIHRWRCRLDLVLWTAFQSMTYRPERTWHPGDDD